MPHDCDGKRLDVGDVVLIEAVVIGIRHRGLLQPQSGNLARDGARRPQVAADVKFRNKSAKK